MKQKRIVNDKEKEGIQKDIANKIFEKNRNIILDQIGGMVDNLSNLSRIKMWRVKEKVCPRTDPNYSIAKMNENRELVTEKNELTSWG